jgi:hypothetical protein
VHIERVHIAASFHRSRPIPPLTLHATAPHALAPLPAIAHRPRINKHDSVKDKEQKESGQFFFLDDS